MRIYPDEIGYVELVNTMGTDKSVVNAARVSLGEDCYERFSEADKKLMRYLADHKHMSPFEHVVFTFKVKAPLFVAMQHVRHRTASYNMISRRYTSENIEVYIPAELYTQHKSRRQESAETHPHTGHLRQKLEFGVRASLYAYDQLIERGVSREQARMVLPQCTYTEYYVTVNLRNLAGFISLRDSAHAQWEIRQVAKAMKMLASDMAPVAMEALNAIF